MLISGMKNYYNGFSVNKSTKAIKEVTKNYQDGDSYESSIIQEKGSPIYKINRMSIAERQDLVNQLKQDNQKKQDQFFDIVHQSINQQAKTDIFWQKISSGELKVDAQTAEKAQKDISESGYWGVKQTSERLFDFACALAGDDAEKMKNMQKAMMKGVGEATKTWSKDLPDICNKTIDAANKLFDDYFAAAGDPINGLE